MKVSEAIALADAVEENRFPDATKVKWLSDLDGQIYNDVLLTHRGGPNPFTDSFEEYDPAKANETDLIVDGPYVDLYPLYLQSRIQISNGDTARYNQTMILYNDAFQRWADYYNRRHMPIRHIISFRV